MGGSKLKKCLKNNTFQDAIFFFAVSIALIVYSFIKHYSGIKIEWKMSPYLFPILISVFMLVLSFILFSQSLKEIKAQEGETQEKEMEYFNLRNFLATLAIVILYYISMKYVSFVIATIILLAVMLLLLGERRWWVVALVSVLTTGVIYAIFGLGLKVNLP